MSPAYRAEGDKLVPIPGPAQRRKSADDQPLADRLGTLLTIAETRDYSQNEGLVRWIGTKEDGTEIEAALTVRDLRTLHALTEQAKL